MLQEILYLFALVLTLDLNRVEIDQLVVPLGSLDETQTEKDLRYFECFLGELKDFNLLAGKPAGTNSKAIINQIRTISKQRIIKPTSNSETCVNIGPEKLKLVEEALIKSIKTIDI